MKNCTVLCAANPDSAADRPAFSRGETTDANLIRAKQGNQPLRSNRSTGNQTVSGQRFRLGI